MAKIMTLIPEIKIYSKDMEVFFPVVPIGDKKYSCAVLLPPNESGEEINYEFETYIGSKPSGIVTNVVVPENESGEVKTFVIDLNVLPDVEGEILVSINFTNIEEVISDILMINENIDGKIGEITDAAASSGSIFSLLKYIVARFTGFWTDARAGNLDAAISTRAPASTALDTAQWTNARAAMIDNIGAVNATGGTTAAGAANAKLNALLTNYTAARAGYLDKLNTGVPAGSMIKSIQRGIGSKTNTGPNWDSFSVTLPQAVNANKSMVILTVQSQYGIHFTLTNTVLNALGSNASTWTFTWQVIEFN